MKKIIQLLLFVLINAVLHAQVWQWSVAVKNARNKDARAFLWIPENCKKVKAVVVTQNNMEEISIVENVSFRKTMQDLSFAIVWVSPMFDNLFRFNEGAGKVFDSMMNDLANVSGYSELNSAPVAPMGHSAAASWPYYFAAWNPGRTLCAISVSGQWPWFRNKQFAPDVWGDKNIDYIPCLETMGEYESANTWSTEGLKERQEHPFMPLSMLACPAEGHFAASEKKIRYIAYYLKKAAQYRFPKRYSANKSPALNPINPMATGWLKDKWRFNEKPEWASAAAGKYTGDTTQAFWFFDEELVRATEYYESVYRNMKAQLLGYSQDGKTIRQQNTHLQVDASFHTAEDGVTFNLKGVFLDTVPGESERPSMWTGLPVGAVIGHANTTVPVTIDIVAGPCKKINDSTFRLDLQKEAVSNPKNYVITFIARHPGDATYKPAVQQAQIIVPPKNTAGKEQHIAFEKLPDCTTATKTVSLKASSDASLLLYFYVKEGPAQINGNTVQLTAVPPRARFPVKVTVVAWQYGRSTEPAIQSAEPIEQSFYINR
jgi:hypothetical protein